MEYKVFLTSSVFYLFVEIIKAIFESGTFVILGGVIIVYLLFKKHYEKSSYYLVTKIPYVTFYSDKGKYGEYLIYKYLKSYEKQGAKFLFNAYIPTNKNTTTEIDVIMICSKGIFVFESKNYSGWIYGNENSVYWYQTLPMGRSGIRKQEFYNPIMQNQTHIKHLKVLVGEYVPYYSFVVFSERCELKSINYSDKSVYVLYRDEIEAEISEIFSTTPINYLNENNINKIYQKLYPFTQVDNEIKAKHIRG